MAEDAVQVVPWETGRYGIRIVLPGTAEYSYAVGTEAQARAEASRLSAAFVQLDQMMSQRRE